MKYINKVVKWIDNITDIGMILYFLFFVLLGLYALYDSYLFYNQTIDDSLLKYKPGYEGEPSDKKIKGNMVAWLTINDTNIDYPVMQGIDNFEYLNKDPFGDYSLAGSIFLDNRNSADFSDYYNLVYGHHMEHSLMFGALALYLEPNYLEEHNKGELIVGDKKYNIELFAVLEATAMQEEVFSPTEMDDVVLEYVKNNATYILSDVIPKYGEKLIALSTCKFPSTLLRTIVFGVLKE